MSCKRCRGSLWVAPRSISIRRSQQACQSRVMALQLFTRVDAAGDIYTRFITLSAYW